MENLQLEVLLLQLSEMWPMAKNVLVMLGSLVVIGQVVVVVTPTKKDDEKLEELKKGFFGVVINMLSKFAVIQKK